MRVNWASALDWIGLIIWLVSLIILPFLKLHITIPSYLWIFPMVSLALTIAYRINSSIIYAVYINIGIILIYLIFVIILVKLWLYLVAGLILIWIIYNRLPMDNGKGMERQSICLANTYHSTYNHYGYWRCHCWTYTCLGSAVNENER
jgi:hypothetical protein